VHEADTRVSAARLLEFSDAYATCVQSLTLVAILNEYTEKENTQIGLSPKLSPDYLNPIGRYSEIERAKGLAISLVVWGHLASATFFTFPIWFLVSISVIYSFHMPLFMYLSGFVYFISGHHERLWAGPLKYITSRADRLLLPFLAIGTLIALGKYILNDIGNIPDPVNSLYEGAWQIISNGANNPAASIWYLFVLFIYTIITPIMLKILGNSSFFLVIVGFLLWCFDFTHAFYIDRILQYFIFFCVGGLVANNYHIVRKLFIEYFILFAVSFIFCCYHYFDNKYALLICGIASMPAFHGLFLQAISQKEKLFIFIGDKTMAIYLLNTIIIGVLNLGFYITLGNKIFYLPSLILFFVLGIVIPIGVQMVLAHFSFLHPLAKYFN